MKQNNIRLLEEVTKLIINILIKDGSVYLPSIGTLSLGSEEANRTVVHSVEKSGGSIVDVIQKRGNCSRDKAQKIYDKWLSLVSGDGGDVSIKGVGKVEGGAFTVAQSLSQRLNPKRPEAEELGSKASKSSKNSKESSSKSSKVVKGRSRTQDNSKAIKGAIAVAVVVVIAVFIAVMNGSDSNSGSGSGSNSASTSDAKSQSQTTAEVVSEQPKAVAEQPSTDPTKEKATELTQASEPTPAPVIAPKARVNNITSKARYIKDAEAEVILKERLLESSDGAQRFRVVCGVVLSPANAGRLIKDVEARTDLTPRVYERSGGYMVTLYESEGFRPCINFIQTTASKLYDYTWVYDEKTM